MPAWPGGKCPACGEDVPENMIRCQSCRVLLNGDLHPDEIPIPEFVPLPEIDSMIDVEPSGFFLGCPHCGKELRIHRKYLGQHVQCKFCEAEFDLALDDDRIAHRAFYCTCPHCAEELRASWKYLGTKVACKHCSGKLRFADV
jgi:uncharacterized protein (DUF983 family)